MFHFSNTLTLEEKNNVNSLIRILNDYRDEINQINFFHNEWKFFEKMWEFWDFMKQYKNQQTYDTFKHTEDFQDLQKFFQKTENYFERSLDTTEAISIITKKPNLNILDALQHNFSKDVFQHTQTEISEINTQNINTLVMTECGPAPETILYICENTNIPNIIATDSNQEAIFLAGKVISKMGLEHRVTLEHCKGEEFDYSEADCVHMTNFLQNKSKVLNQISNSAKNGCFVISRQPSLLSNLTYERIIPDLHPRLKPLKFKEKPFYNFFVFQKFGIETIQA